MPEFRQDMPPQGGYSPINFKRVPAKTYFSGFALIGGYLGISLGAAYLYHLNYKAVFKSDLEMKGASLAIYPMLLAERDRAYLKQLRRNREEEAELMKNVPGWKVGTWYGEPLYKGDQDQLVDPMIQEYYVHTKYSDMKKRVNLQFVM